jgi:hypothetical protein
VTDWRSLYREHLRSSLLPSARLHRGMKLLCHSRRCAGAPPSSALPRRLTGLTPPAQQQNALDGSPPDSMAAADGKVWLTFSGTAACAVPSECVFAADATQADILAAYYRDQQCSVRARLRAVLTSSSLAPRCKALTVPCLRFLLAPGSACALRQTRPTAHGGRSCEMLRLPQLFASISRFVTLRTRCLSRCCCPTLLPPWATVFQLRRPPTKPRSRE